MSERQSDSRQFRMELDSWIQRPDEQAHARNTDRPTSHKAAERVSEHLTEIQEKILSYFKYLSTDSRYANGVTDEELQVSFADLAPSTVRTRRKELCVKGLIRDSGRTVLNSRKQSCTVWELVK